MTFRLINAGKREIWHDSEWLYHVWHPGQAGDDTYTGPHDGKHMSTTALATRVTGRVMPLVENPVIQAMRSGRHDLTEEDILARGMCPEYFDQWRIEKLDRVARDYDIGGRQVRLYEQKGERQWVSYAPACGLLRCRAGTRVRLYLLLYQIAFRKLLRALVTKRRFGKGPPGLRTRVFLQKMFCPFDVVADHSGTGQQHVLRCWQCLCRCAALGMDEVCLYGTGEIARVISVLCRSLPVRIKAVCPTDGRTTKSLRTWRVIDEAALARDSSPIIIATFDEATKLQGKLLDLDIALERILMLE